MDNVYDVMIIGGGPAGLTAGIYSSRARLKTLLVEKALCGGQVLITDKIENFPGFPDGVKGPELADWMLKQARQFGIEIKTAEAKEIALKDQGKDVFNVVLDNGDKVRALSIIIATGARWNTLGIPGENEFRGKGVSYCATCDGPLFRGKDVVVIGGGNTALEDALFLTRFANKVTVVHRKDKLRATKILQERAYNNKKIEFHLNSVASKIVGDKVVREVMIHDVKTDKENALKCSGVFVLIGITPNSDIAKDILKLDEKGHIVSNGEMRTSIEGIFACGDVRKKALRQVVTAAGDGAAAAFSAEHYIDRIKGTEYPR